MTASQHAERTYRIVLADPDADMGEPPFPDVHPLPGDAGALRLSHADPARLHAVLAWLAASGRAVQRVTAQEPEQQCGAGS